MECITCARPTISCFIRQTIDALSNQGSHVLKLEYIEGTCPDIRVSINSSIPQFPTHFPIPFRCAHSPHFSLCFLQRPVAMTRSLSLLPSRRGKPEIMCENFVLRVVGGPEYDPSTHTAIPVNTQRPIKISTDLLDANIDVNIQRYRGLPDGSPSTSPYFSTIEHKTDLYNVSFSFTLKNSISGNDLVFGNDFDHPIRDRLPPGFSTAFNIVKWMIDPGLEGDPYADEPYLYGPLLSSVNTLEIGEKEDEKEDENTEEDAHDVLYEGATGSGEEAREQSGMPADAKGRKKHFLTEANRKNFTFEAGREYKCDFFNPYLDFNGGSMLVRQGVNYFADEDSPRILSSLAWLPNKHYQIFWRAANAV